MARKLTVKVKIIKDYLCLKCLKNTTAEILFYQYISDKLTIVKFETKCCKEVVVKYWLPKDLLKYVKVVK